MRKLARTTGWCVAISLLAAASPIRADDAADAKAWFDRAWTAAQRFPNTLSHCDIRWRVENHTVPPADVLARLRYEVPRAVRHPERATLEMYERHLAGHPDVVHRRFIAGEPGNWRLNEGEGDGFIDAVRSKSTAWTMTGNSLTLMDPGNLPPGEDAASINANLTTHLGLLCTGGLTAGSVSDLAPEGFEYRDGRWSARGRRRNAQSPHQEFVVRFEGTFNPAEGTGTADRVTVVANGYQPEAVGAYRVVAGWHTSASGTTIARQAEIYNARGTLDYRIVLEDDQPADVTLVKAALAIPDESRPDPLRGLDRFEEVRDLRGGYEVVQQGGRDTVIPATGAGTRGALLRMTGWIGGGMVIGGFLIWRFWLRRSGAATS